MESGCVIVRDLIQTRRASAGCAKASISWPNGPWKPPGPDQRTRPTVEPSEINHEVYVRDAREESIAPYSV